MQINGVSTGSEWKRDNEAGRASGSGSAFARLLQSAKSGTAAPAADAPGLAPSAGAVTTTPGFVPDVIDDEGLSLLAGLNSAGDSTPGVASRGLEGSETDGAAQPGAATTGSSEGGRTPFDPAVLGRLLFDRLTAASAMPSRSGAVV